MIWLASIPENFKAFVPWHSVDSVYSVANDKEACHSTKYPRATIYPPNNKNALAFLRGRSHFKRPTRAYSIVSMIDRSTGG